MVIEQVNNFGSLPHRKQYYRKPVRRSKSDASSTNNKKSKRSSILNIFSSTPTTTSTNSHNNLNKKTNKKVTRSKSDVSSQSSITDRRDKYRKKIHLNSNSFNNNLTSSDSDNAPSFLPKKKVPLSPITEVNTPLLSEVNYRTDYFDTPKLTSDDKRHSKSMEAVHSSQMPVDKLPLTRGMAVDKIVKRLSTERLSPPPAQILQVGAFSYTNPLVKPNSLSPTSHNEPTSDVVYAQVVCNETVNADHNNKTVQSKEIVQSRHSASPTLKSNSQNNAKNDFLAKSPSPNGNNYPYRNPIKIKIETDFERDEVDHNNTSEPAIKPVNIRQIPRHPSNSNINFISNYQLNLDNEFDQLNAMRDADNFNGVDTSLSSRRKILEKRIKSRIDGLHFNNNNETNQYNNNVRKSTSPPPTNLKTQLHYGKYGDSNEIINRYSPERSHHLQNLRSSSQERHVSKSNYLNGSTLPKKNITTTLLTKNEKGDSGIEVEHTNGIAVRHSRSRNRKGNSSRFNTG